MANPSNPNGANQYLLDPRQKLCWELYTDPKSKDTFGNGYQSALKAGYEDSTATLITTEKWFIDKLVNLNLLDKAEKNLNKFLDIEEDTDTKIRVKADITKFIASTVGKKLYSNRTELTGADGKDLPTPILNAIPSDNSTKQDQKAESED